VQAGVDTGLRHSRGDSARHHDDERVSRRSRHYEGRRKLRQQLVPRRTERSVTPRATATAGTGSVTPGVASLLDRVISILDTARAQVVRSVNSAMVLAYWQIGRAIVEYHQGGAVRADYGDQLLEQLSAQLAQRVGRGYFVTNLRYF